MSFSTPLPLLASTGCHQYFFGSGVMVRKGKRKRRFTTCKRRRLNHRTNTDAKSWANLPGDKLGMISKWLNFIDNLSFGGVYKSWSVTYPQENRQQVLPTRLGSIVLYLVLSNMLYKEQAHLA
ncbi:hypothetical protein LOK49_LG01G04167 [Camellia lanceoleosa]|uniref:Uncharacterized protein n=1 Tax=Camellia lanceoleosa TaxID=1840588 RepID=A0ACC0IZU0_9ERIC|nr:hypothetical protein LOK49_LG01G04167 [Camellia lanceoleosa]